MRRNVFVKSADISIRESGEVGLVTRAEFARRKKVSRQYVSRIVNAGLIQLIDGKIDEKQANAAIKNAEDPARFYAKKENGNGNAAGIGGEYYKARSVREHYNARLAQLEFEQRTGKSVDTEKVKEAAFEMARKVRNA